VVDAHVRGLRRPDARQIFDNFQYFRDPATGANRDGAQPSEAVLTESARDILALCRPSRPAASTSTPTAGCSRRRAWSSSST
jgi:hypothetical protein